MCSLPFLQTATCLPVFFVVKNNAVQNRPTVLGDRRVDLRFLDEKFYTIATPTNLQNDRIYSYAAKKAQIPTNRLISERQHFSSTYNIL